MIAGGNGETAKQYLEEYVHKIGNLTLTGYNSALSNKSFEEKRDHKNKDGRYDGYKNGLEINKDIPSKTAWTVDDIKRRTDELVDALMKLYQFPGE